MPNQIAAIKDSCTLLSTCYSHAIGVFYNVCSIALPERLSTAYLSPDSLIHLGPEEIGQIEHLTVIQPNFLDLCQHILSSCGANQAAVFFWFDNLI